MAQVRIRKMHLDYLAGLLSIPVLLSAVIINFSNLNKPAAAPTPTVLPTIGASTGISSQQPTDLPVCKKSIGPIDITYPQEGQTISDNPVCITIDYSDNNYCSVVWSYRTNSGTWSDYNANAPCLYNLPNGNVQFQLRVNSTVSNGTKMLTRNFSYTGGTTIVNTPTLQPTATPIPSPTPITSVSPTSPTISPTGVSQ